MATQAERRRRPLGDIHQSPSNPAATGVELVRQSIQHFAGTSDVDGLRDEAVKLVNQFEVVDRQFQKLSAGQSALREKMNALLAHEHYSVVITGVECNGKVTAEVAGLGHSRIRVAVHPDVDAEQLQVGATALVARERNCVLQVTATQPQWRDTGTFERYLDDPSRILLRDRESLHAVDLAHRLRDTPLKKGDLIGYDREVAGIAYERIEAPKSEHLFDENVTDDFSMLGGLDAEVSRIKRHIDFRFRHPHLAQKYGLKNRCGILMQGTPGNGKTKLARCCAGYVRQLFPDRPCRFMHIAGSSDYNMWFGQTEQRIIERFNAVRDAAADSLVVMFWDEIDAIGKNRGTDLSSGAPDRILNTLLSQIDGVVPLSNVIILYATNRPDILDPGLLRPGRIDEKIEVPTPNRRAAAAILHCYLQANRPLAGDHESVEALAGPLLSRLFTPNGQFAEVARVKLNDGRRLPVKGSALLSGALLENVVNTAAQQAAVREADTGEEGITEDDLQIALEDEIISAVSLLAPGNVKSYVKSIPQDAQPIAVESLLNARASAYIRSR